MGEGSASCRREAVGQTRHKAGRSGCWRCEVWNIGEMRQSAWTFKRAITKCEIRNGWT
jgi:hypothetical protein